jgi:hypothetical protein
MCPFGIEKWMVVCGCYKDYSSSFFHYSIAFIHEAYKLCFLEMFDDMTEKYTVNRIILKRDAFFIEIYEYSCSAFFLDDIDIRLAIGYTSIVSSGIEIVHEPSACTSYIENGIMSFYEVLYFQRQ